MTSVSLAVETIPTATGTRTRMTLSGPSDAVLAAYKALGSPGLPPRPDGTTTISWVDPEFAKTQAAMPRV